MVYNGKQWYSNTNNKDTERIRGKGGVGQVDYYYYYYYSYYYYYNLIGGVAAGELQK